MQAAPGPFRLTSAEWQGEVPGGSSCGGGQAGEDSVPLQDEASCAAVADLVPNVEGGALLDTVLQAARISTRVARQNCRRPEKE